MKLAPLTFRDFVELSTMVALSTVIDVSMRSTATLALETPYVTLSRKATATKILDTTCNLHPSFHFLMIKTNPVGFNSKMFT